MTTFGSAPISAVFAQQHNAKKRMCMPVEHRTTVEKRAEELRLLAHFNKPLLGLENGETNRQLYVEDSHAYKVNINLLSTCRGRSRDQVGYTRLDKHSLYIIRQLHCVIKWLYKRSFRRIDSAGILSFFRVPRFPRSPWSLLHLWSPRSSPSSTSAIFDLAAILELLPPPPHQHRLTRTNHKSKIWNPKSRYR